MRWRRCMACILDRARGRVTGHKTRWILKRASESRPGKQESHEYRSPKDSHGTGPSFTRSTCNIGVGGPDVKSKVDGNPAAVGGIDS